MTSGKSFKNCGKCCSPLYDNNFHALDFIACEVRIRSVYPKEMIEHPQLAGI